MRLILLYAAQVAFIIAGFAAVSSVFVSINSDAMSSTVTQLLSSTVTLATAQAVAPLDKFAVQVAAWADMLYANPALLCSDPTSAEWTPEDIRLAPSPSYVSPATFRVTQGKDIKLSLHRNNPLALYVYEAFQMPDNASQWVNCGTGRLSDVVFQFYAPSLHRGGVSGSPDVNSCEGHLSANAYGRLQPQVVESDWACEIQTDVYPSIADYQLAVRALTYNDSKTGQWTGFSSFWDPTLNITSQLMTFAVPLTFSAPDPITGAYHCTNAASMDLNGQWLGDALHAEVIDGVELAMFWDRDESLVAWTLPTPSSDPSTGAVLQAGLTDSRFDAAVTAFDAAGWCSQSGMLSTCVSPSVKASVSNSHYVFAMRRIVHINARFTIVIAGDRSTFFGPGERARAVGIGVSVAVCAVCLATSMLLWLMTVRPLRRLIGNMELAATFSSDVDAEADSCITEVNEANVAFLSMHEELQMAKPFMPQHLLERLEEGRAPQHFDAAETSDMQSVPHSADDTRTVVSSSWRSRSSVNKRSTVRSAGVSVVSLESRFVAVLVINITGFDKIIRCTNVTEMEDLYAKFIDAVLHVAKAHRGVLDSAQGDHIMVSFNSGMKCAAPAAKAINAAFALRAMLSTLPPEWSRISCGIASGHAHCGALGSTEAMSHVTLGTVVRQAIGLQRVARVLDDERRESVADQGSSSVAPGWCVGTARVVQDCVTFAHFRYEAVAVLPPSGRATVIATLFPPVEIRTTQLSSIDASAAEWLYAVGATSSANPHAAHNESVQSTYNSLTSVPAEVAAPLLEVARSSTVNRALSAVAVPQLAPL